MADIRDPIAWCDEMLKESQLPSQDEIFNDVVSRLPTSVASKIMHASGGLPDVRGVSDVDAAILVRDHSKLLHLMPPGTKSEDKGTHTIYSIPGYAREVNIYATPDKTRPLRSVTHRKNEKILEEKFPQLATVAARIKADGLSTEKAWAKVLELPGDPYEAMLNTQKVLSAAMEKGSSFGIRMSKESAQAQAFFLPVETRPKEYPALTKPMGKFWHTGIVKGDKVFETFNNCKYKVSSVDDRLPELVAQNAKFVPVKASTRKLKKEIKSGTSCDEFVLRSTGHSGLSGADKGNKFPEDVFNILTKTAGISFPENEHASLQQRLDAGKEIYTTRISLEKGKYSKGQVLDSPFGKLRVVDVKQGKLKQHPFLGELTEDQKTEIGDHPFDLVKLEKESSDGIRMSKESGQVFEAGGIKYDVEKLWELSKSLPTQYLATDAPDFKDYMKSRSWTGGRTPEEILRDMDDEHKHMSRIKGSDLRHPVIMAPNHGIADGLHRMAKALHRGKDVIRYKQFKTWEEMEPALIKKSSSLGIRMSKEASLKKKAQVNPVQGVQPVQGVEEGPKVTSAQKKQELDAWGRWIQDRNPQDFKFLLDSYTPFMNYMGQRHIQAAKTGGTVPVSTIKADMIQNFHRGLETFDPDKGQLNTHIGNHLRHTGRFVRTYSNIGKMPDPRSRMVWQYKDRETVLTERLGRPPSSIEMADDLGISQKEIELLRTEIRKDIIVDPTTSGLGSIAPESPKAMEQLNFLHMELNPEQQNVLEYTYGLYGRQAVDNNEDLARVLGISPQKVRAIKRQIARRYEKRYR